MFRTHTCIILIAATVAGCGGKTESSKALATGGTAGTPPPESTGGTGAGGNPVGVGGGVIVPNGSGGTQQGGDGGSCSGDACIVGCGNGKIDPGLDEACDDANTVSGDGCSADCSTVEQDFACLEPGKPCVSLVACGDGKVRGAETCDDANTEDGDGCTSLCVLELGWTCPRAGSACVPSCGDALLTGGEQCDPPNVGAGCGADCRLESGYACDPPPSPATPMTPAQCHRSVCGDDKVEGIEACDDGNTVDGDGCSAGCTLEPACGSGTCTSTCGDGIELAPEGCDDGNVVAGDGCAPDCNVEPGFTCDDAASSPPERLNLAVTYRDFMSFPRGTAARHPDFEADWQADDVTPELVAAELGPDGVPVLDGRCSDEDPATLTALGTCPYGQMLSTAESFAQWYADVPGVNSPVPGALALTQDPDGSFTFDSDGDGFYPIDGKGFTAPPATEDLATADATVNDGQDHDFGFTTEIRYFFQYRGGELLTFSGDDDLWVFVNRKLALDVGGLHPRVESALDVDARATALGLERDGIYEIAFFHAERHSAGSNFKLTLTGFEPKHSLCHATCGDGVIAGAEECDLGPDANTGGYDGCNPDCTRGPSCGDAIVQAPTETCDDGNNVTPYAKPGSTTCAPGCTPSGFCGDGNIDSLFGEECDDGPTPRQGTGCTPDCRLGARCGDGIVQSELGETCDDGNTLSGDMCSRTCKESVR